MPRGDVFHRAYGESATRETVRLLRKRLEGSAFQVVTWRHIGALDRVVRGGAARYWLTIVTNDQSRVVFTASGYGLDELLKLADVALSSMRSLIVYIRSPCGGRVSRYLGSDT